MRVTKVLSLVIVFIFLGCGRTEAPQSLSALADDGQIKFKVITSSNTIVNQSGHFSLIFQAKDSLGQPLSGLENASYSIYENDSKTSESRIVASKDQKTASNQILLLLDFSGSIIGSCDQINTTFNPTTKKYSVNNIQELHDNSCYNLITSAKEFVDKTVNASQGIAIYYFNSKAEITPLVTSIKASATHNIADLKQGLDELYSQSFRNNELKGWYSTNLYGATVEATKTACYWVKSCDYDNYKPYNNINIDSFNFASVVIFTDGEDQAELVDESEMLNFLSLHDSLYYYSIGLGNVNDRVLSQIGKDGYMKASDTQGLNEEFNKLADELNSWANSFYRVDYCPAIQEGKVTIKIKVADNSRGLGGILTETIDLAEGIDFKCDL